MCLRKSIKVCDRSSGLERLCVRLRLHTVSKGWQPWERVGPAVAGVGDNVYFFTTTPDGRILYNRARLGQAGLGWQEVEGGGRTNAAPAAAAVGTHIFLAVSGQTGLVAINQADLGEAFGAWH
jgi:hypothetical protein